MNIVIFGCGKLGHEAIDVLGSEHIECFCDNNPALAGTEHYGKKVLSFREFGKQYHNQTVIICARIRFGNAYAMAEQCEGQGIKDYFFYQSLREKEIFPERAELLTFLKDTANRQAMKSEALIQRMREVQKQADYLKRHMDIRYIRPADGKLREWQLTIVKTAAELLEKLSDLEIKPFLYGGNLLGHVRHDGFIPWDDDMDFAVMRKDYEKLKAYCNMHMYTKEEFYGEKRNDKDIREELKDYYYGNGGGDEFNIYYPMPNGGKVVIDFFVLDYYADHYSYQELMKAKDEIRIKLNDAIADKRQVGGKLYDDDKRIACFQETLRNNSKNLAEESGHIYFGIDNMEIMHQFHRGDWIPRDVVFPLKRVWFEGAYFYVPNDAEEFLKYEYEDIWALPDDIGVPQHVANMGGDLTDVEMW